MDTDVFLVLGVVFLGLAFPSFLNAYSGSRPPRTAALLSLCAVGLIGYALSSNPSGYTIEDVPRAFVRVVGKLLN